MHIKQLHQTSFLQSAQHKTSLVIRLSRQLPLLCRTVPSLRLFGALPKHDIVGMPALSPTMKSGTISKWLKSEGDKCVAGDAIADIETDKAVMAFECQDEYIIAKFLVSPGSEIAVGAPLMVTVDTADAVSAFANYTPPAAPVPVAAAVASTTPAKSSPPVAAPVPVPAPAPAIKEAPATVPVSTPIAAPIITVAPVNVSGVYSVRFGGRPKSSPLSNKLVADRKKYVEKYGRCGHSSK